MNAKVKKCKLPNFLIVGAAKSGTTSLYHYLKQHPEIYIPSKKECRFFSQMPANFKGPGDKQVNESIVKTFDEYNLLFSSVTTEIAIGDVSPDYLYYYQSSIKNIKQILGIPKILLILRNPVEGSYSQYLHFIRDGRELCTFEEALENEGAKKELNWEWAWFYKDVRFYYKQVSAYMKNFTQVKVYLYDDFKQDTLGLVKDIYEFLEVDSSFVPDLSSRYNVSLIPKNKLFHKFLTEPNVIKDAVNPFLKIFLSEEKIGKTVEVIKDKNLSKPEMKPETREYLINMYREDILKLQVLIQRNLSGWLR